MLRVPKRGVVDVELGSFPCPVEIGVVRRPPPPIKTDCRMSSHFLLLPEHLLSPALPFPLVARHPLSCEEAHDIVVIDLSLLEFGAVPQAPEVPVASVAQASDAPHGRIQAPLTWAREGRTYASPEQLEPGCTTGDRSDTAL